MAVPAGYYAPEGSRVPLPCGGSSHYCPGGEGAPHGVSAHDETYTDGSLNPHLNATDKMTRTSVRACALGFFCESGQQLVCPTGHWCANGVQHPCQAGTLGNATGLGSRACGGPCPSAHYCLEASTAAQPYARP